jgi:hypothetical protein
MKEKEREWREKRMTVFGFWMQWVVKAHQLRMNNG